MKFNVAGSACGFREKPSDGVLPALRSIALAWVQSNLAPSRVPRLAPSGLVACSRVKGSQRFPDAIARVSSFLYWVAGVPKNTVAPWDQRPSEVPKTIFSILRAFQER